MMRRCMHRLQPIPTCHHCPSAFALAAAGAASAAALGIGGAMPSAAWNSPPTSACISASDNSRSSVRQSSVGEAVEQSLGLCQPDTGGMLLPSSASAHATTEASLLNKCQPA